MCVCPRCTCAGGLRSWSLCRRKQMSRDRPKSLMRSHGVFLSTTYDTRDSTICCARCPHCFATECPSGRRRKKCVRACACVRLCACADCRNPGGQDGRACPLSRLAERIKDLAGGEGAHRTQRDDERGAGGIARKKIILWIKRKKEYATTR